MQLCKFSNLVSSAFQFHLMFSLQLLLIWQLDWEWLGVRIEEFRICVFLLFWGLLFLMMFNHANLDIWIKSYFRHYEVSIDTHFSDLLSCKKLLTIFYILFRTLILITLINNTVGQGNNFVIFFSLHTFEKLIFLMSNFLGMLLF